MTTYVFDLDGTLCTTTEGGDYSKAEPIMNRIKKVNELHDAGNTIKILTARGMGRHYDSSRSAYKEFYELTLEQLREWGVKFDNLFLGKPSGDFYIDDKGVSDDEFFKLQ